MNNDPEPNAPGDIIEDDRRVEERLLEDAGMCPLCGGIRSECAHGKPDSFPVLSDNITSIS